MIYLIVTIIIFSILLFYYFGNKGINGFSKAHLQEKEKKLYTIINNLLPDNYSVIHKVDLIDLPAFFYTFNREKLLSCVDEQIIDFLILDEKFSLICIVQFKDNISSHLLYIIDYFEIDLFVFDFKPGEEISDLENFLDCRRG